MLLSWSTSDLVRCDLLAIYWWFSCGWFLPSNIFCVMHVRNIARMVWPVVTGGGGCSLGADVSMWFSNPRHNRDLCSGGGGDNTNTTTTPTQGTIQDFRDRLSIFCGSYHASITSIITPSHHASITNSPTHHSLYFPSSIETRIRIDPDPTNMKIARSLISYPPDKSFWPTIPVLEGCQTCLC